MPLPLSLRRFLPRLRRLFSFLEMEIPCLSKKTARLLFDGQGSPPFLYLIFRRSEVIVDSSTNSKTMRRCKFLFWIALIFFIPFCSLTAKETPTVSSAVALHKLEDGNKRFVEGKNTFPDIGAERRGETAKMVNSRLPRSFLVRILDCRLRYSSIRGLEIFSWSVLPVTSAM